MKALVVVPYYYPKVGGLENYARQLNIALNKYKDWQIVVATSNDSIPHDALGTSDGMKVYRLGTLFKFSNTPLNPLWPLKLKRIIKNEKPDIILSHTPVPSMSDAVSLVSGKIPIILFYHAATLLKSNSPIFNAIASVYRIYESFTLKKVKKIAAVSQYVKDNMPLKLHSKVIVIPNAVWNSQIIFKRKVTNANSFIFIGSLDKTHSWKGLDQIIEAFSVIPNESTASPLTLTIIGDGNYRYHYENLVHKYGLESRISFKGRLVENERDIELAKSSALICYPNSSNDAFPTVLLEAWSQGVPVIAGSIGPIPSLIQNGINGILVNPRDPQALANTLTSFAARDTKKIIKNATALVAEKYTWETQAEELDMVARQLL